MITLYENYVQTIKNDINDFILDDIIEIIRDDINFNYDDIYPNNNDDDDDDDGDGDGDFMFETKEKAYEYVEYIKDLFISLNDPIEIYRSLNVDDIKDIDLEYLGNCWSFEKHSALNFGSRNNNNNNNNNNYNISAEIEKKYVDWKQTILAYINFSDTLSDDDENEIYIGDENSQYIKNIKIEKINYKK